MDDSSIDNGTKRILEKSEKRKASGRDPFIATWQAILEISLFMAREHLEESPGQLLPGQINDDREWSFFLDIQEKLDLPPDTNALLITPSTFRDILIPDHPEIGNIAPKKKDVYWMVISDDKSQDAIMQVTLPETGSAGIDVYDDGVHFADYTYNTALECIADLKEIPWMFFKPKAAWTAAQIIRYTENWFAKGIFSFSMEDIAVHEAFSYLHHPELLNLSQMEAIFTAIEVTLPKEFGRLEELIQITNEMNQNNEFRAVVVSKEGVMNDDLLQCAEIAGQISVQMDQYLDKLTHVNRANLPDTGGKSYSTLFDTAMRNIYQRIVGRPCPMGRPGEF